MADQVYYGDQWIKRIRGRLCFQNKNWLAIICGQTGSGKSYSAISLAQKIVGDKGAWYVVLDAIEFMTLINSGKLRRGDIVIFDEAGVGMSSREWYSVQNKMLGAVLQTFRILNVGVIFTTPDLSFIDVQARKLFHNYLETAYLDQKEELAYLKIYDIQVNSRFDKIYYKHPRFKTDRGVVSLSHLVVPKPEIGLDDYEDKKKVFTQKLNENALKELRGDNKIEKRPRVDEAGIVKDIIKNKDKYLKTYRQHEYLDKDVISSRFKVGLETARRIKKQAEGIIFAKKGADK